MKLSINLTLIKKYKKKILNIAIIFILTLIINNAVYKRQTQIIESLEQKKDSEIKKNALLEGFTYLEKSFNSYKNLFYKKDVSLIINTINNIAKEADVKVISIKPDKERDYTAYIEYPFKLVISSASYHAIGNFISKIENSPDIYMVESMEIELGTGWTDLNLTGRLIVNLILTTVSFKG